MTYESRDLNAMILPLPVRQPASDKSLRFIDLSHYETFFDDLARGFPYHAPPSLGCAAASETVAGATLQVFEVGNYVASFVPTASDFERLDPQFTLPTETWRKIPGYDNYGFAVFQLASGSLKPHPMAFEFQTEHSDLFFPTVHIHDGEVHESEKFDHILYMQHAGLDSSVYGYQNAYVEDKATRLIRSEHHASEFCKIDQSMGLVDGNLLLHRKIIHGDWPNRDTVFSIPGDPIRPSINLRPWLSYSPWLIVVAAIGWFFKRRSRLKATRQSQASVVSG